jgi:alginate O-acetyltransferase complex protein AlgI
LIFYAWGELRWFPILLGSVTFNFTAGLALRNQRWRKTVLVGSVIANLALLGYFKYAGFFSENLTLFGHWSGMVGFNSVARVSLPVGISFYTFQCISYLLDVYREETLETRSFSQFFLYIGMFPHLIAGPIVRFRDVRGELAHRPHTMEGFSEGISRLIIGLGKKVLIANPIAAIADTVFQLAPDALSPVLAWIGIIAYTLQIYFDFSGYSDMAIGLARLFGIHYKENFNYPYAASSISNFWQRWHISLSQWFRDYLYIPLGGNRHGPWMTARNLLLVFLLCGLWHGANWTFILWGLLHGFFLSIERTPWGRFLNRGGFGPRCYTLLVIVLSWVPFRTDSLSACAHYYRTLSGFTHASGQLYRKRPGGDPGRRIEMS